MNPGVQNGHKYGRLTCLDNRFLKKTNREYLGKYQCDCGSVVYRSNGSVKCGNTNSCGCLRKETTSRRMKKHGLSESFKKEYHAWHDLHRRCNNPTNPRYHDYGGRGIMVCSRWDEFENFIADVGKCPNRTYSIDRIDNNGNYEPSNVRWTSSKEQAANRRPPLKRKHEICKLGTDDRYRTGDKQ